jgi:hypothetical protein
MRVRFAKWATIKLEPGVELELMSAGSSSWRVKAVPPTSKQRM